MSGFKIDITGNINKKLDELTAEIQAGIQDELNAFGLETVAIAKSRCPVDDGFLRNSITFDKTGPLEVQIIVASKYSAYVEFGTGLFAAIYVPTLPIELQAYAREFYINGKGRIAAHPFLFPALEIARVNLIKNLKTLLK